MGGILKEPKCFLAFQIVNKTVCVESKWKHGSYMKLALVPTICKSRLASGNSQWLCPLQVVVRQPFVIGLSKLTNQHHVMILMLCIVQY